MSPVDIKDRLISQTNEWFSDKHVLFYFIFLMESSEESDKKNKAGIFRYTGSSEEQGTESQ